MYHRQPTSSPTNLRVVLTAPVARSRSGSSRRQPRRTALCARMDLSPGSPGDNLRFIYWNAAQSWVPSHADV